MPFIEKTAVVQKNRNQSKGSESRPPGGESKSNSFHIFRRRHFCHTEISTSAFWFSDGFLGSHVL